MSDPTAPPSPDLAPLTIDYDVVGELGSRMSARILIATRKSGAGNRRGDDGRVLIEIVPPPAGDESHALQHLASDIKTLSGLHHRRIVQAIEGRWLGDDAFAIIRERVDDPSLAERLAQGETFTNTRTAAILREVHGVLEWARDQNIVHRNISPERIYLEPVSDRVRVSFAASPIPRIRTIEPATEDALCIVRLAVTMLTGKLEPGEVQDRSLAELRPDLPDRLLEETATLLDNPKEGIDVPSYLALIGMADPVAEGETERDRIRAEVLEEQRVEREKLANERAEFEREKAEERRTLAAEGEELRRVFEAEKARLEREFAGSEQALADERTRMQRILADERAALLLKQEDLELALAARQAALDRAAAADRATIEELRARIRVAGELEIERRRAKALEELDDAEIRLDTGEMATPAFVRPYIASLDKITFRDGSPLAPESVRRAPKPSEPTRLGQVVEELHAPRRKPIEWRRWLVPTGIAAALVIALISTIIVGQRATNAASVRRPATPVASARPVARPAAATAPPARSAAVYTSTPEQAAAARRWLDSLRNQHPVDMQWALLQAQAAERRVLRARAAARTPAQIAQDSAARAARTPRFVRDSARQQQQQQQQQQQAAEPAEEPKETPDSIPKLNSSGIPQ